MSQKRDKLLTRLEKQVTQLELEVWHKDVEICVLSIALGYYLDGHALEKEEFVQYLNKSLERPEVAAVLAEANKDFFTSALTKAREHLAVVVQGIHEQIKTESK